MTVTLKHATVVAVPDDGVSPVGTTEWNAEHTAQMTGPALIGRSVAGAGVVEEIAIAGSLKFVGNSLLGALTLIAFDKYTAAGTVTWTKPQGARLVLIELIANGGNGGNGSAGDNTANRGGAGGGAAGGVLTSWFDADDLPPSLPVTLADNAANASTVAIAGNNGANATWGNMIAFGGRGGGAGGTANTTASQSGISVTIDQLGATAAVQPGAGGVGSGPGAGLAGGRGGVLWSGGGGPGGGAGGPGMSTAGVDRAGVAGGAGYDPVAGGGLFQQTGTTGGGGAGGTTGSRNGVNGTAPATGGYGSGGGSGASSDVAGTVGAGNGGDGSAPGGGGGGGGGARAPALHGVGGLGARGEIRVWTYG
jgi:hypothetical protein